MKNEGTKVTMAGTMVLVRPVDGFYGLEPLIQGPGVELPRKLIFLFLFLILRQLMSGKGQCS